MKMEKKIPQAGSPEWEAICRRCGRCCYEKLDYRGRIYYTRTPCPHLDTASNRCRIYAQRAELHPECAQLTPELTAAGILPADCPYVVDIDDYQPPEMQDD